MGSVREERAFWVFQLHSTLLNSIGAAIVQSRVCERAIRADAPGSLDEVRRLQSILGDLEVTTRNLAAPRPSDRTRSLADEIRRLIDDFHSSHPEIRLGMRIGSGSIRVQRRTVLAVRVVLQEALTNAARHGSPSHVEVDLALDSRSLLLRIRDDGCGFHIEDIGNEMIREGEEHPRWGVRLMREHAEMAGGRLEFSSAIGRGTQVTLHIPLPQ